MFNLTATLRGGRPLNIIMIPLFTIKCQASYTMAGLYVRPWPGLQVLIWPLSSLCVSPSPVAAQSGVARRKCRGTRDVLYGGTRHISSVMPQHMDKSTVVSVDCTVLQPNFVRPQCSLSRWWQLAVHNSSRVFPQQHFVSACDYRSSFGTSVVVLLLFLLIICEASENLGLRCRFQQFLFRKYGPQSSAHQQLHRQLSAVWDGEVW